MCHGSWSLRQMEQMHVELQQDEPDEREAPTVCSPPVADRRWFEYIISIWTGRAEPGHTSRGALGQAPHRHVLIAATVDIQTKVFSSRVWRYIFLCRTVTHRACVKCSAGGKIQAVSSSERRVVRDRAHTWFVDVPLNLFACPYS